LRIVIRSRSSTPGIIALRSPGILLPQMESYGMAIMHSLELRLTAYF